MSNNEAGSNYSPPHASAGVDRQPRVEQRNLNQEAVSGFKNLRQLVKNTREILQLTRQSWSSLDADEQTQIVADLEENLGYLIEIASSLRRTAALRPQIGLSQHLGAVDEAIRLVGDQVIGFKRKAAASARAAARPPELSPPPVTPVAPAAPRPATPRPVSPPVSSPPREAAPARSRFEPTDTSPEAEEAWSSLKALFINLKDDRATKFHDVVKAHLKSMSSETAVQKYEKKRAEKKWKHIFDLWDGLKLGVSSNDDFWKLLWVDAKNSRERARGKLEKENILDFCDLPEIRPLIRRAERNMSELRIQYRSLDEKGRLTDEVYWDFAGQGDPSSVERERSIVTKIDGRRVISLAEERRLEQSLEASDDFQAAFSQLLAFKSNLPRNSSIASLLNFQRLLQLDIRQGSVKATQQDLDVAVGRGLIEKNSIETLENINKRIQKTPESVLGAVFGVVIVAELRFKHFAQRYRNYLASPQDFDPSPVMTIDPYSRVLYNVRAYGRIPESHQQIFRILRLNPESIPESERIAVLQYLDEFGQPRRDDLQAAPSTTIHHDSIAKTRERVAEFVVEREKLNAERRMEAAYPLLRTKDGRDLLGYYQFQEELIPRPTTHASNAIDSHGDSQRARGNDNLLNAFLVRRWLDMNETVSDFALAPVMLEPHSWLSLPPLWDVLTRSEYNLTFDTYVKVSAAWDEFHAFMEKEHVVQSDLKEMDNEINKAISLLSKYKGMFGIFSGRQKVVVQGVVSQLFLRMIKDYYDQISQGSPELLISSKNILGGRPLTSKELFAQRVIGILDQSTTLEKPIRKFLIEVLRQSLGEQQTEEDRGVLRGRLERTGRKLKKMIKNDFFSGEKGLITTAMDQKENYRREEIQRKVLLPPATEDEKKGK